MTNESRKQSHYLHRSPVTGAVKNPMDGVRYLGLPTFMRTPVASTPEGLDIGLVGVPPDAGLTNQPGTRHGNARNRWLHLARGKTLVRKLPLTGADIVEVSPPFDPSDNTTLVGASLTYELLCLLVESIKKD